MNVKASTIDAYNLMHDGTIALSQIEANGIRMDTDYIDSTINKLNRKIDRIYNTMKEMKEWRIWKKTFGNKTKIRSREQLGIVLFDKLGYTSPSSTDTGKYKVDEEVLEELNSDFVNLYIKAEGYTKAKTTYLEGFKREIVDGYLHPFFNLHTVSSFRSSSSNPNFQNIPIRDPEIGKIVRTCFIPRSPKNRIVEIDYSGIEVRIAACVTGSTKIRTIDGNLSIKEIINKIKKDKVYVYGYDLNEQRISISEITEGGLTRKKAPIWRVTLDNGEYVEATKDHKFLTRDGKYVKLQDLTIGISLMPLYIKNKKSRWKTVYEEVYLNNGTKSKAHNLIAKDVCNVQIEGSSLVVHHKDGNGCNNSLDNLEIMDRRQHMSIHSVQGWKNNRKTRTEESWTKTKEGRLFIARMNNKRKNEWTEKDWIEFGNRVSEGIKRKGGRIGKNNPRYGKKATEETKIKISKAKTGKKSQYEVWNKGLSKLNDNRVRKLSNKLKGKKAWNKGRRDLPSLSDAVKAILSEKGKGRKFSEKTKALLKEKAIQRWADIRRKEKKRCSICGRLYTTITNTHLNKHNISIEEYKKTYNHKVTNIEFMGYQDVYNINVSNLHNYAVSAGVIIKNCYHKDPVMIEYIKDITKDMHRDMAAQIYMLPIKYFKEGTDEQLKNFKNIRYCGKNMFVFPQFYGDYYKACTRSMWKAINKMDLKDHKGRSLYEHLNDKGITRMGKCDSESQPRPGTFEDHMQKVEDDFWNNRFKVYGKWKKDWYEKYKENLAFRTYTGFLISGYMTRNECINIPVQGPAFHCMLMAIILLNKTIKKYKMKAKIIGQIHDSVLGDVPDSELKDYIDIVLDITTNQIPNMWKWIIVPLDAEVEVAPVGKSWFEKEKYNEK